MALIMTSAAGSIPYMDRRISDGTHLLSDAKDLVHQLRKEWRLDEISSKEFNEGYNNKLVAFMHDDDVDDMSDVIVVRVYGRQTEMMVNREQEIKCMVLFHRVGCAAQLYCRFNNGFAYQYSPGRVLDIDLAYDPHIMRFVGRRAVSYSHRAVVGLSGDTSGVAQMVETAEDGLLRSIIVDMRSFCPRQLTENIIYVHIANNRMIITTRPISHRSCTDGTEKIHVAYLAERPPICASLCRPSYTAVRCPRRFGGPNRPLCDKAEPFFFCGWSTTWNGLPLDLKHFPNGACSQFHQLLRTLFFFA